MADDYSSSIGTTGRLSVGGYRSGVIETGNDSDWFAVQLVAYRAYTFTVEGISLADPYIELFNSSGGFIAGDDDSGPGLDAMLRLTPTVSGTYYVAAWGATAWDLGSYYVSASTDDYSDTTRTSGRATVGGSVTGRIESADDIDWFKVTLSAGTQYTIQLKGAPSGAGTLQDPFFNGIHDSGGHYIAGTVNDDFGSGTESKVVFTPAVSGSYYLAAAAYDTTLGSYTLSVAGRSVADIAASTATSTGIALNGTVRSTIGSAGDVDWIKATLAAGTRYVIELNGDTNAANALADPSFLGIYNAAGRLIANTSNDDYGIGLDARVTFTPSSSGTYYLAAGAYRDSTGAYALRLLSTSTGTDSVGQTPASAAALAVGTPVIGSVNFARDIDWYKLNLSSGQDYKIDVRGLASGVGTLADPEILALYNASGVAIPGTGNDDAPGTLDAQALFRPTSSGVYYVAVDAADDGTGSFRVSVEAVASSGDLAANATTTGRLAMGGSLSSTIDSAGDVDWVRVTLSAGTRYTVEQRGQPSGDGTLADALIAGVYNAQGLAVSGSGDDDGGTGANALATFTAPASGNYFVAAASYGSGTGTYKLTLTAAAADTTAPTLQSTSPADNASGVQTSSNLTLEFSEAVRAGSGNIVITGGGTTRTIPVTDTAQVTFSGDTMTIDPAANLVANTEYAVTFAVGAVRDLAGNAHGGIALAGTFNFKTAAAGAADSWTLMVYMAADNNLEQFAIADLNEMESVTLPGSVNVVTLVDRAPGYDSGNGNWTDTRAGAIRHDNSLSTLGSTLVSQGELNTGRGSTLTNFIDATVAANPASRYGLIVWDHGGGLSGTAWDDSSSNDNLTLSEMRQAVDASTVARFDFIGFDACLQGLLEQAWELRELASVVVASQELEPGDGWEYQDFLARLAIHPNLTPYDLASAVVETYGNRYAGEADTTLSATRTSALSALRSALDGFVGSTLSAGGAIVAQLHNAAERTLSVDGGRHDYRDLGDFMQEVSTAVSNPSVKAAAADVLGALRTAVLAKVGTVADANGLSIYLPTGSIDDSYTTQDYRFLQSSTWGNFLRFFTDDQADDVLVGDSGNNDIRSFDGNDTITGGAGNDRLDGGAGADRMTGGDGSDTYYVQHTGDRAIETNASAGSGGTDRVYSALPAYTLATNVENGRIDTAASASLTGNGLNNVLTAGAGNNTLNGAGGNDTADYSTAGSAVTVSLARIGVQATGGSASDTLIAMENLIGSRYNDTLTGSAGSNTLQGGAGSDRLSGNGGIDRFVLSSRLGSDTLTDFGSGNDKLVIDQSDLRVGDGDTTVGGAVVKSGSGGFATTAELVIMTGNIAGSITEDSAATRIGSATGDYASGQTALFMVDNGSSSELYLFTSSGANATVSAAELTLLATLSGTASTVVADYLFLA